MLEIYTESMKNIQQQISRFQYKEAALSFINLLKQFQEKDFYVEEKACFDLVYSLKASVSYSHYPDLFNTHQEKESQERDLFGFSGCHIFLQELEKFENKKKLVGDARDSQLLTLSIPWEMISLFDKSRGYLGLDTTLSLNDTIDTYNYFKKRKVEIEERLKRPIQIKEKKLQTFDQFSSLRLSSTFLRNNQDKNLDIWQSLMKSENEDSIWTSDLCESAHVIFGQDFNDFVFDVWENQKFEVLGAALHKDLSYPKSVMALHSWYEKEKIRREIDSVFKDKNDLHHKRKI